MYAVLLGLFLLFVAVSAYVAFKIARERGWQLSNSAHRYFTVFVLALFAIPAFAQSGPEIDIDLTSFWDGFNQFFNGLSAPILFIAAIPAALGFLFLIANLLKKAFGGSGMGKG